MEISELLSIIRIKLSDPISNDGSDTVSLFKTDELIYYINNALREAVFRGKLLVKQTYLLNLISGTREYKVPTGAVNVVKVLDENNEPVSKIHESDLEHGVLYDRGDNFGSVILSSKDWRNDKAELPYYFMQNATTNKLVFYPIPSKNSTVTLRATYIPDNLDETDELPFELSEIYQPDLIYWVLFEALDKKDAETYEPGRAEENKRRFEEIFGEKLPAEQFQEMLQYPDDPGSMRYP